MNCAFLVLLADGPSMAFLLRGVVIAISLGLWFWTQSVLGRRVAVSTADQPISDGMHRLTARWHQRLVERPGWADALLIASSGVIDGLGLFLVGWSVFGPSFGPFVGVMMIFSLRQAVQMLCPLPPPPGMIWRHPGVPSLLATYGTGNDLFFSGHTAIAVYGATELASAFGPWGVGLGLAIAGFEIATVLVLRAHYTMDVFAGAVTALYVHHLVQRVAPWVDDWLATMGG